MHSTNRSTQRGALLLEVLISILIFSFAILGLVALQARAVQFSVEAEDRNSAALLANELVAIMWAKRTVNAGDLAADVTSWQTKVRATLPPFNSSVGATITNGNESGAPTADVTITWIPVSTGSSSHTYSTKVVMP